MRQNHPDMDLHSFEGDLVSNSEPDYETASDSLDMETESVSDHVYLESDSGNFYIEEEIIEDDDDDEDDNNNQSQELEVYHDDEEEEEIVLSEDEEVADSCDGSNDLFDTPESPKVQQPERRQQQQHQQSHSFSHPFSMSNSISLSAPKSQSHSRPEPHQRSQMYEVETVISLQSETSAFHAKQPEPSHWDAETNSMQPTVETDDQNSTVNSTIHNNMNHHFVGENENYDNNDAIEDNIHEDMNGNQQQGNIQLLETADTIDDSIHNEMLDESDGSQQQGSMRLREPVDMASNGSPRELPPHNVPIVSSIDTELDRAGSEHGLEDPTQAMPFIPSVEMETAQPLQQEPVDQMEAEKPPSEAPNANNRLSVSNQDSFESEVMPENDQVRRESISNAPISPRKAAIPPNLNDSILLSPKPRPLPKPREPEESVMHQYVDQSDWPQLLKFMEKLRKQSSSVVSQELTKTDPTARATVLHRIIAKAPLTLAKLLISIVPFDDRYDILMLPDMLGNTPLHIACATLQIQSKTNSIDETIIKTLSVGAPEAHHVQNQQGDIPLSLLLTAPAIQATTDVELLAVESQAEDLIRRILHEQQDLSSAQNKGGQTLLHVATTHRVHERVSMLLLDNASYAAGLSDSQGKLPIHHVAATPYPDHNPPLSLVERLIVGAPESLTAQCSLGNTPLHWLLTTLAQYTSSQEDTPYAIEQFAEMLLGRSTEETLCPLLVKNKEGLTPFHFCALHQVPTPIVQILIRSHFAPKALNITDMHMASPLHIICASSNISTQVQQIGLLGAHSQEASTKKDDKGHTPLHIAVQNSQCTDTVIKAVIDINPKAARIENSKGRLPFHLAIKNRSSESILNALLRASPKAVKSMFEGNNGVIHEMCQYKAPSSIIELALHLFPEGARLENKFHNLPLHVATAYQCDLATVKALIKSFPQACNHQNKRKDVPLHYAIISKRAEAVIDFLIKTAPSSVMIPNETGQTPLDLSKENGTADFALQAFDEVAKQGSKKRRDDYTDPEPTVAVAKTTNEATPSKKLDSFHTTLERARTLKVPSKAAQKEPTPKESSSLDLSKRRSRSKSRDDKRGRSKSRERSKSRDKSDTKKRDKSVDKEKEKVKSEEREGRSRKREKDHKSSKRAKSVDTSKTGSDSDEEVLKKHVTKSLRHLDSKPRKNDTDTDKGKKQVRKSHRDLDYKAKERDKSVDSAFSKGGSDDDEKKRKKKTSKSLRKLGSNSEDSDNDEKKRKKKASKSLRKLEYNSEDSDNDGKKNKKKTSKSLRNLVYDSQDTDDDEKKSKRKVSKSLRNLESKPKKTSKNDSPRRDKFISKSLSNLSGKLGEASDEETNPKKSKPHRSRSKSRSVSPSRHRNTNNGASSNTDEKRKPKRSKSTTRSELNTKDTYVERQVSRSSSENVKYDKPPKSPHRPPLSPGNLVRKKSKAAVAVKGEIANGSIKALPPTATVVAVPGSKRNSQPQASAPIEKTPSRRQKKSILKTSPATADFGEILDKESMKRALQKKSKSFKDDSMRSDSRKEKKKKTSKQLSDDDSAEDNLSLTPQSPRSGRRNSNVAYAITTPSNRSSGSGGTLSQSRRGSLLLDEMLSPLPLDSQKPTDNRWLRMERDFA